jgi:orotate phosphoribosyltransferase
MTAHEIIELFRSTSALLNGHFILTSGAHSPSYFQCARVLQYPEHAKRLCGLIADHFRSDNIQVVVAPAVGGILVAHEVASSLGCRCMFAEREKQTMIFRRGFQLEPGERVLVVEDVVTTGGSLQEVITLCQQAKAVVAGIGFIVDRSNGSVSFPAAHFSLLSLAVEKYEPDQCPLCHEGKTPAVKPGSRGLTP